MLIDASLRRRIRRTFAGSGRRLRQAALLAGLAAVAQPAVASREVETLRIVPIAIRWIAGVMVDIMVIGAILAIVLVPLLVWIVRRAGHAGKVSRGYRLPSIVSLRTSSEPGPAATGNAADEAQRRARLKAQAEAIELRPQVPLTVDVDDATRKRITEAVKRIGAHSGEGSGPPGSA